MDLTVGVFTIKALKLSRVKTPCKLHLERSEKSPSAPGNKPKDTPPLLRSTWRSLTGYFVVNKNPRTTIR